MGLAAFKRLGSGLLGQVSPAIAVDFGVGSLKVLQVSPGEAPTMIAAACVDTPMELYQDGAGRLAFQLEALTKQLKEGGFRGRRVTCAIPAVHTWCKHLQIAKVDGVSLEDQVATVAGSQIGCDPAALMYRHTEVAGANTGGKSEVICMATPREFIRRLLMGLKERKLEPVGMHSEYAAALGSFAVVNRRAEDATNATLYLDMSVGGTKVTIAHGTQMVFARLVEVGGRTFDETVASQTKDDIKTAHAVRLAMEDIAPRRAAPTPESPMPGLAILAAGLRSGGIEPAAAPAPAPVVVQEPDLTEPVETLVDEVRMSLRYHEALFPGKRVARVVFMGGETRHRAVSQYVAKAIKLQAQLADPLARVLRDGKETVTGVDTRQPQPGWATPVGLALLPTDL